mgnify:CR=1 FL=1|tara:strand:- start:14256 stop:14882 length:627 start_codon:yes stop_codon:yes gene_type:complete
MNHINKFIFIRHGETDWNALGKLQFHTDNSLNDYGRKQSLQAALILASQNLGALYFLSSPYARAVETADIVTRYIKYSTKTDIKKIKTDKGLAERYGGSLDGMQFSEFEKSTKKLIPEGLMIWDHMKLICPKVECSTSLVARMQKAIEDGYNPKWKEEATLVIVGHLGAMDTFSRLILNQPGVTMFKNATPYLFENTQNGWVITELSA